jgi:hypothetical protein
MALDRLPVEVPRPTDDSDRAVSPLIGGMLLFALLIMLLAILQTTAIPALNSQLEFQHSERVRTDMTVAGETIERTAATGSGETVGVETGLRYPPRLLFVNPPPVSGRIGTTPPETVTVANAAASGETGDYWTGVDRTVTTRSLAYRPNYNEYDGAPTTVVEPWVVFDRFEDARLTRTESSLVDERRISLVALTGERSASSAGSVPLSVRPTSATIRTVTLEETGDPIRITVPTDLPEDTWRELLAEEYDPDGDPSNDRYVTGIDCRQSPPAPCEELTITLEPGASYELRAGAVAVGSNASEPQPAYLTDVEGDLSSVPEGGRQRLVVEARDELDNPISGVTVEETLAGPGTLTPVDPVTDQNGRAVFVYEAPGDVAEPTDVTASLSFGSGDAQRTVAFDVRVVDLDGESGGSTGTEPVTGGDPPSASITDVSRTTQSQQDRFEVTVEASDPNGDLAVIEYELRDSTTGAVVDSQTVTVGGGSATETTELSATGNSRLAEYRIVATVVDGAGNEATDSRTVPGSG